MDDYTLQLQCDSPKANMLRLWIPILPEHIWKDVDPKKAGTTFQNTPPIIGSGPFQTVEWKKGSYVKLVANPGYWRGRPKIDQVFFLSYQDADSMVQELKKGVIDAAYSLPPAQLKPLQATKGLTAISFTTPTYDYLAFNCYQKKSLGNPVLRDVNFRRALGWAINKPQIVKIAYAGLAKPADTPIPPGTGGSTAGWHWTPPAADAVGFDLQKAAAMLDAAGYLLKNGVRVDKKGKPIELRLWARSESLTSQKAGKLMAGWFGQLGLKIDFQIMDEGAMSDKLYNYQGNTYVPDYDMYLWDVVGYTDPGDTLALYTTEQIALWNDPCWSNRPVRRTQRRAAEGDGPGEAAPDDLGHAADLLHLGAADPVRLSGRPGGLQHLALDGVGALAAAQRRRLLYEQQHGHLSLGAPGDGRGCQDRLLDAVGGHRRLTSGRGGGAGAVDAAPPPRQAGGRRVRGGRRRAAGPPPPTPHCAGSRQPARSLPRVDAPRPTVL